MYQVSRLWTASETMIKEHKSVRQKVQSNYSDAMIRTLRFHSKSPSTISIKMNSTEVFILEIKKHPRELFISFSDFRGDSTVQHSLL